MTSVEQVPKELQNFQSDTAAIWIFDHHDHSMIWANDAALDFWKSPSLEDFIGRDYSADSKIVQERILQTIETLSEHLWTRDSWTFYPKDEPKTVLVDVRLFQREGKDPALLFKIIRHLDLAYADPEGLRMMQAARATQVAVTMFDLQGRIVSENPAALRLRQSHPDWSSQAKDLSLRYYSPTHAKHILDAITKDEIYSFNFHSNWKTDSKVLSVTAKRVRDPVTGDVVAQITEEDVTEHWLLSRELKKANTDLENRVAERSSELEALNRQLAEEIAVRKSREQQLKEQLEFTQALIDHIPTPVVYQNNLHRIEQCNISFANYLGVAPQDIVGKKMTDALSSTYFESLIHSDDNISNENGVSEIEVQIQSEQKPPIDFLFRRAEFLDGNIIIGVDLTSVKTAERRLKSEKNFLTMMLEAIPVPVFYKEIEGTYLGCNEHWASFVGSTREKIIGREVKDVLMTGLDRSPQETDQIVIDTWTPGHFPMSITKKNGEVLQVISYKAPFETLEGIKGIIGTVIDVTEQKRVEKDLRSRELILREATMTTQTGFIVYDNSTRVVEYVTDTVQDLIGASDEKFALLLENIDNRFPIMNNAQGEKTRRVVDEAERLGHPFDITYQVIEGPKAGRKLRVKGFPQSGMGGDELKRVSLIQDITENVELEERLRQTQKYEAIGKLTGGIAHDFNNLLAVAQGNAELLEHFSEYKADLVEEIVRACQRGAELTHSLLAYARQQPLNAAPTNLGELSLSMQGLLSRALGEEIRLSVDFPEDLWTAFVDGGQAEDALLNLAINARDAMPDGGVFSIKMENKSLEEHISEMEVSRGLMGDFVVISISDTGFGMSEEVISRAVDPFFTTKSVGEGSGLGLSMVYGFAIQSGGDLQIFSEIDVGTTIKLYLPRSSAVIETGEVDESSDDVPMGNSELIVIVEDDDSVRKVVEKTLASLKYTTISFNTAVSAADYLKQDGEADLLLTDVVLPGGMRGSELAAIIRKDRPEIGIILMSGYPAEALQVDGVAELDTVLLRKPVNRDEIAKYIDVILSGRRRARQNTDALRGGD